MSSPGKSEPPSPGEHAGQQRGRAAGVIGDMAGTAGEGR